MRHHGCAIPGHPGAPKQLNWNKATCWTSLPRNEQAFRGELTLKGDVCVFKLISVNCYKEAGSIPLNIAKKCGTI